MAMYENANGLDLEIERLTKELTKLDPITDEYKAVRVNLDTLYQLRNAQYKVDVENEEKQSKTEKELEQKAAELEVRKRELDFAERQHSETIAEQKKDRVRDYVINGLNIASGILKLGVAFVATAIVVDQGYKFERDGCPTSQTFREARKNVIDILKDVYRK